MEQTLKGAFTHHRFFIMVSFLTAIAFTFISSPVKATEFEESASATASSIVVKLDPFVVNLAAYDRFVQASISLQVADVAAAEKLKVMMPKVKHTVIMILSSKDSETVRSFEGKKLLVKELKSKINKAIGTKEDSGVSDVFLENFVIQ